MIKEQIDKIGTQMDEVSADTLHRVLMQISPVYGALLKEAKRILNLLPPSAARRVSIQWLTIREVFGKLLQMYLLIL